MLASLYDASHDCKIVYKNLARAIMLFQSAQEVTKVERIAKKMKVLYLGHVLLLVLATADGAKKKGSTKGSSKGGGGGDNSMTGMSQPKKATAEDEQKIKEDACKDIKWDEIFPPCGVPDLPQLKSVIKEVLDIARKYEADYCVKMLLERFDPGRGCDKKKKN